MKVLHRKKTFPSAAGMSLTKHSLGGNNLIIPVPFFQYSERWTGTPISMKASPLQRRILPKHTCSEAYGKYCYLSITTAILLVQESQTPLLDILDILQSP